MFRALTSLAATLLAAVAVLKAQPAGDAFRDASDLLQRYVSEQKIAGAVAAVAQRGRVVYLRAVGVQDLETRAPMTERSLFRIYSMTKPITAAAAMMLEEEGRFALGDPVARYLPEFNAVRVQTADGVRAPSRAITIEDLLLHTSGLSHRTSQLYRDAGVRARTMTLPQLMSNIARTPLMEDPGTAYRYSEGTSVVGRLIEVWSGTPFDVFLSERLFKPLGMTDTGFWATQEQRPRLTTVYTPAPGGGLAPVELETVPFTEKPALLEGAVGLLSTVPDFMRFSQMLLNGGELNGARLLKRETVDRMTRNGLSDAVRKARGGTMGWGLANVNVAADGEYGWDGTAGTIFWIAPASQTITILMTQSSPPNPDSLRQRFKALVKP